MIQTRFSHIALTCKDPLALEHFYCTCFGFRRARVVLPGPEQIVFLKKEGMYLELFRAAETAPTPPATGSGPDYPGWRHLAFQVDDVDVTLQALGDAARITLGPLNFDQIIPGWRTVWIADPEGNIVEISQNFIDDESLAHE